jgi:RNA polymerase sigma-70 factor (ECF subfamily)
MPPFGEQVGIKRVPRAYAVVEQPSMPTSAAIRSHLPTLKRYALVLTREPDQAQDLVQETLLRALAGARTWSPGREPLPWLLAILHNAHVSRQRRRSVETAAEQVARLAPAALAAPQPERVHFNQTMTALMRLPEEQREVLVLIAIDGLSYKDAADVLGLPIGTLMSRLARARQALREATGRDKTSSEQAAVHPTLRLVR